MSLSKPPQTHAPDLGQFGGVSRFTPSERVLKQIEAAHVFHYMNDDQKQRAEEIRQKSKELAMLIATNVKECREQSIALTDLERVQFHAVSGIARNG